jgi:hypothetical protein
MWFATLASGKDQVIGVDTPGQQVLPKPEGSECKIGKIWTAG